MWTILLQIMLALYFEQPAEHGVPCRPFGPGVPPLSSVEMPLEQPKNDSPYYGPYIDQDGRIFLPPPPPVEELEKFSCPPFTDIECLYPDHIQYQRDLVLPPLPSSIQKILDLNSKNDENSCGFYMDGSCDPVIYQFQYNHDLILPPPSSPPFDVEYQTREDSSEKNDRS